jgi:hypothetical protein
MLQRLQVLLQRLLRLLLQVQRLQRLLAVKQLVTLQAATRAVRTAAWRMQVLSPRPPPPRSWLPVGTPLAVLQPQMLPQMLQLMEVQR